MTITQLAIVGDSLAASNNANGNYPSGGRGSWVELVRDRLASVADLGPLVSAGFRSIWRANVTIQTAEWVFAGGWTSTLATDAWDKALQGGIYDANLWANGSTKTATWTRPAWMPPIVGIAVDIVDKTNSGDAQYRVDGGTWTNFGQTLAQDNRWLRFYIATAVTSTIEFRCYNGSVGVDLCLVGVEPYFVDPRTATAGFVVHDLAIAGSSLRLLLSSTAGDRLAFFSGGSDGPIKLGTGSPIRPTPNAGTIALYVNDSLRNNTTEWNTDLTTFNTRVSGLGLVGLISPWEVNTTNYNTTYQSNYRTQSSTTAASLSMKYLNIYAMWAALGFTANAGIVAAGFVDSSTTHLSAAGQLDLAERLYWWVRNNFFPTYSTASSSYPARAEKADVAYAGRASAVMYSAGLPVTIG